MNTHFYKSAIAIMIATMASMITTSAYAAMSSYDMNKPVGFATVGTTPTGGEGGSCVTVTSASELESALSASGKSVIYIKGAITVTSMIKVAVSDKTLLGLPGSYLYNPNRTKNESGILYFKAGSNVIMRNVTFKSAGAYDVDGNDNFCLDGMSNVWIDHCDFQDGVDGNFDCKNASNNIAVTWCYFHYLIAPKAGGSGGANDHRFTDLWGSSDSATQDKGKLNTTFMFCWWGDGCVERMPRVRYGKIHILNCLYNSTASNYCVGGGINADLNVDRSAFYNVQNPYKIISSGNGAICEFDNCEMSGCKTTSGGSTTSTGTSFKPSSYYTISGAVDANKVKDIVSNTSTGAGATLTVVECKGVIDDRSTTPVTTDEASFGGISVNNATKTSNSSYDYAYKFSSSSTDATANMTASATGATLSATAKDANGSTLNVSGSNGSFSVSTPKAGSFIVVTIQMTAASGYTLPSKSSYTLIISKDTSASTPKDTTSKDTTPVTPTTDAIVDASTTWDLTNSAYSAITASNPINKLYASATDATAGYLKIDKILNGNYIKFVLKAGISGTLTIKAINGSSTATRGVYVTTTAASASAPSAENSSDLVEELATTTTSKDQQTLTTTIAASNENQSIYIYNVGGAVKYYSVIFTANSTNVINIIANDESGLNIFGGNGHVYLSSESDQNVTIYTANGKLVKFIKMNANEELFVTLPTGIYIANGKKFIVK